MALFATARARASRLIRRGAFTGADRARARTGLADFVEELGLTLDALTEAAVGSRIDTVPGRRDLIVVTLLARFPDGRLDRRSMTTFGFGPGGITVEDVDFGHDVARSFEALTRRVVDALFPDGGTGLAASFVPAASVPRPG